MFKCELCNKEFEKRFYMPGEFYNVCRDCFKTKYWLMIVAEKHLHIIVDGTCYCIGSHGNSNTDMNGFGGSLFKIEKYDGRIIETNNLWFQGDIPEEFKEQLPDNAKFVD